MKFKFLLPVLCLFSAFSLAQSADLDREQIKVSYVKLPTNPIIEKENRTYSSNASALTISGYKKKSEGAVLDLDFDYFGTEVNDVNINKVKHEKKDKDGNVTSTSYTYNATANYVSTGTLTIYNTITSNTMSKNYSETENYKSNDFNSYNKARDYYNDNRTSIRNKYRSNHKNAVLSNAKSYLNSTFGFVPQVDKYEFFWILGSKRHPEFARHHEAFDKLKVIFDKMKYDEPTDELKKELEPIIAYFESVIPNYQGKKRKLRKVRYASYYNIAKIYYYLDNPEKAKEYAQKIIDNDYDKSDGKYFNRIANKLIEKFEANKIKTRHFAVVNN